VDEEEDVRPHIVLVPYVVQETLFLKLKMPWNYMCMGHLGVVFKVVTFAAADKAGVAHVRLCRPLQKTKRGY
jgi:hypothetical protein